MKHYLTYQKGFTPALLVIILAVLGITSVGAVTTAANQSKPGDRLFGLDKAIEELKVVAAANKQTKAQIRLDIAQERLKELKEIADTNRPVEQALEETRLAVNNATAVLSDVEVGFKENKITIQSSNLQALLVKLEELLTTYQTLIKKVEVRIKDERFKAKVKLIEKNASNSATLAKEDIDDLKDDDKLNASITKQIEVELKGLVQQTGSNFQITTKGTTYTLTPSEGIKLENFVGKQVELKGFAQTSAPTQVVVKTMTIHEENKNENDNKQSKLQEPPKLKIRGLLTKKGNVFILTSDGKTLYTLVSTKFNLDTFVNQFVKAEGTLTGNTLTVSELEIKPALNNQPVSPALPATNLDNDNLKQEDKTQQEEKSGSSESTSQKDSKEENKD